MQVDTVIDTNECDNQAVCGLALCVNISGSYIA